MNPPADLLLRNASVITLDQAKPTAAIVAAIKGCLEETPPELASDIMEYGIVLTGGGALLKGLDQRIRVETGMPTHVSENALINVVVGSEMALEEIDTLKKVLTVGR